MKCTQYFLPISLCVFVVSAANAQISRRTAYATRAYWVKRSPPESMTKANDWKGRIQLQALQLFKEISQDYSLPRHERGYAKLYLGKQELEMGHLPAAERLLAEADEETDAFWGDELLLDHYRRFEAHTAYRRKRKELARRYTNRRDMILRDEFEPQRIHFLNTRSCVDCSRVHSMKYRSMYNRSYDRRLRLSACFDFCNERIDALTDGRGTLTEPMGSNVVGRIELPKTAVDIWDRSVLGLSFMDSRIGKIEGWGYVWHEPERALDRWRFVLHIRTDLFPSSGMEQSTKVLYGGVVQGGVVRLLDVDGRPFISPFVMLDGDGRLNVRVHYRRSCGNAVARFLHWVGEESVNVMTISFQMPKEVVKSKWQGDKLPP